MGLGKLIQETGLGRDHSNPASLKKLIREHFREHEEVPPLKSGGVLRASAFASLCPREEILCATHNVSRKKDIEPDLSLIFAHGTGLHHVVQNRVLPSVPNLLLGRWKCFDCGKAHGPGPYYTDKTFDVKLCVPRPQKCAKCGCKTFTYDELHLHSDEYRLGGHPDGFLNIPGQPGLGVLEAKSIGQAWKVKQVPDMGHVIQAHIYMWLAGLKWAIIFYWVKGTTGLDGLIEHHVERDEETIDNIKVAARSIFDTLDPWWKASEKAPAPIPVLPERICSHIDCERAGECAVATLCFKS